jgi:hypothetical protein
MPAIGADDQYDEAVFFEAHDDPVVADSIAPIVLAYEAG